MIYEALSNTCKELDAFIINNNTPIERPFESQVLRDMENTKIYYIDTSKFSGKNMVVTYPYDEFTTENITKFVSDILEERENDFSYELDL